MSRTRALTTILTGHHHSRAPAPLAPIHLKERRRQERREGHGHTRRRKEGRDMADPGGKGGFNMATANRRSKGRTCIEG